MLLRQLIRQQGLAVRLLSTPIRSASSPAQSGLKDQPPTSQFTPNPPAPGPAEQDQLSSNKDGASPFPPHASGPAIESPVQSDLADQAPTSQFAPNPPLEPGQAQEDPSSSNNDASSHPVSNPESESSSPAQSKLADQPPTSQYAPNPPPPGPAEQEQLDSSSTDTSFHPPHPSTPASSSPAQSEIPDQPPTSGFTPNPLSSSPSDHPSSTAEPPTPAPEPDSKPINPASLPSLDISPVSLPPPPPPAGQRTGARSASTQTSIDRQRRFLGRLWAGMSVLGIVGGVIYLGREWDEDERRRGLAQDRSTFNERIKRRGSEMLDYFNKPLWKELLPPPLPFPHGRPYTLIIDIDDLLVASTWDRQHGWRTAKRPGVDYFLAYMSQFYEIVIFTTQYVYSAQPVLESLDPFQAYIQYRLFREATRTQGGKVVKDLAYLNRDLSKVIMLDTVAEHATPQPENAIILPKWDGKPGDKGLVGLIPFLESIAIHKVPDVRPILQKYAGKDIATEYATVEAEQKRLAIEEWEHSRAASSGRGGLGGFTLSGMFGGPNASTSSQRGGMPMSYLEQKRAEAQKIYQEEQQYFAQHGEEMKRLIEEDKQRQLNEMKGSLFGYLGIGAGGGAGKEGQGPGVAGAPVTAGGSSGATPPVVGAATSGKSA